MTNIEPNSPLHSSAARAGLIERAKNIIMTPRAEWERVNAETTSIRELYVNYACILAAIGPIATIIRAMAFGGYWGGGLGFGWVISAIIGAIVSYFITLGVLAVLAIIAEAVAPSFSRSLDRVSAFKLIIYSATPGFLASIFLVWWPTAALAGLGFLYGLYVLYVGWPILTRPKIG